MNGSFRIGRIRGIDIRLHFTFLLILPVIAVGFARQFAGVQAAARNAGLASEHIRGSPYFWGTAIAVGLFVSVLIHELAHALYAQKKGGRVRDITLLMIGGVANLAEPPREPRQEAMMALVGPLTSLGLAVLFLLCTPLLGATSHYSLQFAVFYLGSLNLVLGLFNLLPAFPMDGGRILRGLLASRMGVVKATQVAATLGKVFAVVFAVASFVTFNFFLMVIAFFVYIGAEAEARQMVAKSVLGEVRVAHLLQAPMLPIEPSATAEEALQRMVRDRQLALLVRPEGANWREVTLDDVERVPPGGRASTPVAAIAREAVAVSTTSNVWDAMRVMSERALPLLPVVDENLLVGVLSHDDVVRSLRLFRVQRRSSAALGLPRHRPA